MRCSRGLLLLLLVLMVGSAMAQSLLGTWKGAMRVPAQVGPGPTNPKDKEFEKVMIAAIRSMKFVLVLQKDKTFTLEVLPSKMNKAKKTASGTWTVAGNKVTLTTKVLDGKAPSEASRIQVLTLSKDAKTMVLLDKTKKAGDLVFNR